MNDELKKYLNEYALKLFDIFSEGIIITDENMVVQYTNPSFLEQAQLKPEQIIGKSLPDVRERSRLPEVMATKKPLLNSHKITPQGHKGESVFESYTDLLPLFHKKNLIGAIIVVRSAKVLKVLFDQIKEKNEQVEKLGKQLQTAFSVRYHFDDIVGLDSEYGKIALKAAESDRPVLLIGESGTGKEVFAQSIHNYSNRRHKPFVDINCAVLQENLFESELFGYAPGSFTGANKSGKIGLFEAASGGTLFLDEISEMPLHMQASLLRVLEEKYIRRIGETKNRDIDVRIIAATNKNLKKLIKENLFREDLYFRLAFYVINIPPLRTRVKDIELFINYFLNKNIQKERKPLTITEEARYVLYNYSWPGNIRQVKNAIAYACDVAEGNVIKLSDLPPTIFHEKKDFSIFNSNTFFKENTNLYEMLDNIEKDILKKGVNFFGKTLLGRKKMANTMGISIATLYNKLRKYDLL